MADTILKPLMPSQTPSAPLRRGFRYLARPLPICCWYHGKFPEPCEPEYQDGVRRSVTRRSTIMGGWRQFAGAGTIQAADGFPRDHHHREFEMDNWKQVKGKVKEKWGNLTDDDLTAINGQRDQLEGKIQERYG